MCIRDRVMLDLVRVDPVFVIAGVFAFDIVQHILLSLIHILPDLAALRKEYRSLHDRKTNLYEDYRQAKKQMQEYGVVKDVYKRQLQHGTGNGDALPFAAGEVSAGGTAYGLIAVFLGIVQKDFLLVLDTVAVAVIGVIH